MNEISRKVLCVDDEPNVLEGIQRQLRGRFELVTAVGAKAGLAALAERGPFAAVISDYMMPQMNGIEFLREVGKLAPDCARIMLTGCGDLEVAVAAVNEGHIWRYLNKPCKRETLENAVREALEHYRLVVMERQLMSELNDANARLRALNENLEDRVRERTEAIQRLHAFLSELSGIDTVEAMARLIVQTVSEMLQSRRVSLMLPDPNGEYLTIAAAVGMASDTQTRVRVPVGLAIAGTAYAEKRRIVINDPAGAPPRNDRYEEEAFAVVPLVSTALMTSGKAVGVLNVTEHTNGAPYEPDNLATLEAITESSALALQNLIRLQQRNEARDSIIMALAKLAEHRDPETGAHLERVQAYCRLLSEGLSRYPLFAAIIDEEFIETIVRSSPLHDVGKVGIADSILLKPGRLTPQEFEVMKTHTIIGGDTIREIAQRYRHQGFLLMGMQIAYSHHERYDGSGYPKGLKGEETPLAARIVAVADVYDAMVSRRVYKAPLSHEEAVTFIRDSSGTLFDPRVVDVFVGHEDEFRSIARQFQDRSPEATVGAATLISVTC